MSASGYGVYYPNAVGGGLQPPYGLQPQPQQQPNSSYRPMPAAMLSSSAYPQQQFQQGGYHQPAVPTPALYAHAAHPGIAPQGAYIPPGPPYRPQPQHLNQVQSPVTSYNLSYPANHATHHHQQQCAAPYVAGVGVQPPSAALGPTAPKTPYAPVSMGWLRSVANGALQRDGTALAACVDYSQLPTFLTLPSSATESLQSAATAKSRPAIDSNTCGDVLEKCREAAAQEMQIFIVWIRSVLSTEVDNEGARRGATENAITMAKRTTEVYIALAASVFLLHVTKWLQGVSSGAYTSATSANPPPVSSSSAVDLTADKVEASKRVRGKKSNENAKKSAQVDLHDLTAVLEGATDATRNLFLKGLVKACDLLQELHTAKRSAKSFNGFPGWDTAVVVSLIHVIQNVCQSIKNIEEELLGNIMRSWRKLFVFLQNADPEVPNDQSRRRGALAVANSLLIVFFQQDNTHQCRTILSSIESAEKNAEREKDDLKSILKSSSHLVAEMVKFRFFQGRIRLFDRNYEGAFAAFSEASRLLPCIQKEQSQSQSQSQSQQPKAIKKTTPDTSADVLGSSATGDGHPLAMGTLPGTATAAEAASSVAAAPTSELPLPHGINAAQRDNKLRVTFYQIASSILANLRVPPHVLTTDPTAAKVFRPILAAIQNGSPAAFTMAIDLHGSFLKHRGVYMLLQQARIYCYLVLLQKVHAAVAESGKDRSMIPVGVIIEALAAANHFCCDASSEGYLFGLEESEQFVCLAEGQEGCADSALSGEAQNEKENEEEKKKRAEEQSASNAEIIRRVKKLRVEVDEQNERDDVNLWIARLIARNLVRGYLSYEHQTLVLSQKEPFPAPSYTFTL